MKIIKNKEKKYSNELNCKFIRINPDEENFKISRAKSKIFRKIIGILRHIKYFGILKNHAKN